ncbi:efflux RND transporter periplasmic adaptor subunit [Acetoanaerobium sticklandii]|uniref:efflux RND transporter periplasmic adaptor subunit n=1 Tax=Acetoanaerobium sticklandii TaxID=1511 RepID=UPI003A8EA315
MKKKIIFFIVILISILIIIMIKNNQSLKKETSNSLDLGVPIQVENVELGNLAKSIHYTGLMESKSTVNISSKITAEIKDIYVNEGDWVEKGSLIAKLDDSKLIANKKTLESKLKTLKINSSYISQEVSDYYISSSAIYSLEKLESEITYVNDQKMKMKILLDAGAIPKNTYDELEQQSLSMDIQKNELKTTIDNNYESLENQKNMLNSQVEELKTMIDEIDMTIKDTEIRAPLSGNIRVINYEKGDLAIGTKPFVTIDDRNEMKVLVSVSEKDLSNIKENGKVKLGIIGRGLNLDAQITKISSYMNSKTKMTDVEININQEEILDELIIGSTVDVEFVIEESENSPLISKESLVKQTDATYVYTVKDGLVTKKQVEIGIEVKDKVAILNGIETGEKIAIKNLKNLYDGAKVYIYQGEDKE